jgi:preprotein translocase subunit YajC
VHSNVATLAALVAAPAKKSSGGSPYAFLILIALFVVAYLVFIRPARNRQRAATDARRSCEVGDEVTTTSGLIATVVAVDDDELVLEVSPGVRSRYLPAAIMRVNEPDLPDDDGPIDHESISAEPEPGDVSAPVDHGNAATGPAFPDPGPGPVPANPAAAGPTQPVDDSPGDAERPSGANDPEATGGPSHPAS